MVEKTLVCPFLFRMKPSDLKGPLVQFQATEATKEDTLKLVAALNGGLDSKALPESKLQRSYEVWWDEFESELVKIPASVEKKQVKRSSDDMIEEVGETENQNGLI